MKQCYMLTSDEKSYIKQVLMNTLRLTSKRKEPFRYLSNIEIRETADFVCCKIIGERIVEEHAWLESPYGNRYRRKIPVTWFYAKDGDDFNKLAEELITYSAANYMVFEKFMENKEIDFDAAMPYSDHSTFVDWLCDQSIKNIAPNEEIKNNFKKVVDMISSIGIKSANTKLVMYNNIIEDFAIGKEND